MSMMHSNNLCDADFMSVALVIDCNNGDAADYRMVADVMKSEGWVVYMQTKDKLEEQLAPTETYHV